MVCIVYNVKSVQWEQSHFLYVVLALWGKTTMWAVGYEVNDQKLIRRCRFYFPSNFGNKYKVFFFSFLFLREKYKVLVEKLCMYIFKCHVKAY